MSVWIIAAEAIRDPIGAGNITYILAQDWAEQFSLNSYNIGRIWARSSIGFIARSIGVIAFIGDGTNVVESKVEGGSRSFREIAPPAIENALLDYE